MSDRPVSTDALETMVATHGAGRIAAVIVEPLAGSTGVLVPPVGYLERLRALPVSSKPFWPFSIRPCPAL